MSIVVFAFASEKIRCAEEGLALDPFAFLLADDTLVSKKVLPLGVPKAEQVAPLVINISRTGANVTVAWNGGIAPEFQMATTIDGPWQLVAPGLSSPVTLSIVGSARFFRVVDGANFSKIVGYVNVGLLSGYNLLSNPLLSAETGGNVIKNLFASLPGGSQIFKFNSTIQNYDLASVDDFTGEILGPAADLTLVPGEGVFVQVPNALSLTFVGEVETGALNNPIPTGGSIRSAQLPKTGRLMSDLGYQASNGDSIHLFSNTSQKYSSFHYSTLLGWLPSEPVIQPGQAFWVMTAEAKVWTTNF